MLSEEESNDERLVFYLPSILSPVNSTVHCFLMVSAKAGGAVRQTPTRASTIAAASAIFQELPHLLAAEPAITGIRVSEAIKNVKQDDYSNCYLALSAQVDSVQVRNAVDAAKSAWGVDVTKFADRRPCPTIRTDRW